MSLFTDASLVMIPSGVKDQKVYSVTPIDGTGDLTFSRSNDTATRVNSSGLIEKVRTNVALYSEQLDNAYWIKAGSPVITVTANAGTAPDGTTTADRCSATSVATSSRVYTTTTWGSGEHTLSLYVKNNGGTNTDFRFSYYDSVDQYFSPTITLTNEWQRVTYTFTPAVGAGGFWLVNTPSASGDLDLLAWGAQLEQGVATDYIATTSSAVSVGPVANLPRLDYSGGATCPKLLLEPQRTNLIQYSEQFNNAWWSTSNSTISANAVTSPDGYTNADSLVENTANSTHGVGNVSGLTLTAAAYTFSVFVKKQNRNFFAISTYDGSSTLEGYFNINTGAVATMPAGLTGAITSYGNGWYRCSVTRTMGANANNYFSFNAAATDGGSTYTGTGVVACSIYGGSLELGAYATSYIPTLGAASTRGADTASKTGISSLFGSAFSLFVDIVKLEDYGPTRYLVAKGTGGTYENWIAFEKVNDGVSLIINDGSGGSVLTFNKPSLSVGQRFKIGARCQNGSYAFYVNGELIGESSAAFTPSVSTLDLHYFDYYGNQTYNQVLILSPLSNADLATLTTI